MERTKRQHHERYIVEDYNGNKKRKLQHQNNNNINKSEFENVANEIIYEIFQSLEIYHVYGQFFNLNTRFQNLLLNYNLPLQVNVPTMSKSSFENFHKDIILPNKHRINILLLSNPFTVDIVFSPLRTISKFLQLETLILDNINAKYLYNILNQFISLPQLHSLSINPIDYIQNSTLFYLRIFRLPKLKYCKIKFESKDDQQLLPPSSDEFSPIEKLVINNSFQFQSFNNLLSYLPQLRYLSIDCLNGVDFTDIELYPIALKHLKYVSLELDCVYFDRFEKLIKNFFYYVEVLRFTSKYDSRYLHADKWEELITSYMPNLRVFDINHDGSVQHDLERYHNWINEFTSSFWISKQWFFTHQHDFQDTMGSGIFYSTKPYRRKDYTLCWDIDKRLCSHHRQTNFKSVQHVYVRGIGTLNNCIKYFPNATELIIKDYSETSNISIPTTLNRIVSLAQISKLIFIDSFEFPFEELIKLLCFTSNLQTLKYDLLSFNKGNPKLIQKTDAFQCVSKRNKIKNLDIGESCTLKEIEMIINLFSQLEYLKTGIIEKDFEQMIRFLLSKNNNQTSHLLFLCILKAQKVYLSKLKMLIKSENLLDGYLIKFVDCNLYLWC